MNEQQQPRYVQPDVVETYEEAELFGDTPAVGSHVPLTSLVHAEQA